MKKIITLTLTLLLSSLAFGQYSQNIDSMSRKEIKQYLTSDDYTGKAKNFMKWHKATHEIAIAGYGVSAIIFFLTAVIDGIPTNEDSADYTIPQVILVSSLGMTFISELSYAKAVKVHKADLQNQNNDQLTRRDAKPTLNTIFK